MVCCLPFYLRLHHLADWQNRPLVLDGVCCIWPIGLVRDTMVVTVKRIESG